MKIILLHYPLALILKVGFKTDSNIALGWSTVFDRKSASIKHKFRITFISVPAFRKATIEEMKEDNWKK